MRQSLTAAVTEGIEVDVTPKAGVAVGNIFTYGAAGASLRVGQNLDLDYGRPSSDPASGAA
jgi:hypothetical protein